VPVVNRFIVFFFFFRIGRPEGYRINLVIQSSIAQFTKLLQEQKELPEALHNKYFMESFKDLLELYRTIVEDEFIELEEGNNVDFIAPERISDMAPAVCDFCNCDIWNRHFRCSLCQAEGDDYDTCLRCYARGRGCDHRASSVEFIESYSMTDLRGRFSDAIKAWNSSEILATCAGYEQMQDPWVNG
jgi:hypothetical protein